MKEIKISTDTGIRLSIGSVDENNVKSIFMSFSFYSSPLKEGLNIDEAIPAIKKIFNNNLVGNTLFDENIIYEFDMRSHRQKVGKFTYSTIGVYMKYLGRETTLNCLYSSIQDKILATLNSLEDIFKHKNFIIRQKKST